MEILKAIGILDYFFEIYDTDYCKKVSNDVYMKSLVGLGFPLQNTVYVDVRETCWQLSNFCRIPQPKSGAIRLMG